MTIDPTSVPLVHPVPEDITVERHSYADGLPFDLYRPRGATAPTGVVVLVTGYPDPGMVAVRGKPMKDWASSIGWARLIADAGVAAVTYVNRTPADVTSLLAHLRAHAGALGIDARKLGVWACSGHGPTALAVIAREDVRCAALLYPMLIDVDGATAVRDVAPAMYFALPALTIDDVPRGTPILIVRAGKDTTPALDDTLRRFVAAARDHAITVIEHADAPHAFDLLDDTPRSREVIAQTVAFLREHLG